MHRYRTSLLHIGWAIAASATINANAEALLSLGKNEPIGTYGNMAYDSAEGYEGYVSGIEITLTKGATCSGCRIEHFVILQCAQGLPGAPSVYPAVLAKNKLTFNIKANGLSECTSEDTSFTGTFDRDVLIGKFGNAGAMKLKKQSSIWDQLTSKATATKKSP